jgi:hypothetical protein
MSYAGFLLKQGSGYKIASAVASITGTGSVSFPSLRTVLGAVATVVNAPTTLPSYVASISSISGNSVSVVVFQLQATATAVASSAQNVEVMAYGY